MISDRAAARRIGGIPTVQGLHVGIMLEAAADAAPNHPAVIWESASGTVGVTTYRQLRDRTRRLASALLRRQVRSADRVLVHMNNSPDFVVAWFACAYVGAIAVTTNTASTQSELAYFCENSSPVGAVTQEEFVGIVTDSAPSLTWCLAEGGAYVDSGGSGASDAESLSAVLSNADAMDFALRFGDLSFESPLSIQYTSGTTARPKGVLWTHGNGVWGARVNAQHEMLVGSDIHLVHMPLFHTNALAYSLLPSVWARSTVVLMAKFSVSRFWEIAQRHACTWSSMNAFSLAALSAPALPPDRHSFRLWGAGVCDPPAARSFGVPTIGWWGMTETISHPIVGWPHQDNRQGSMGRAAPEYDVYICHPDSGDAVSIGDVGELRVAGECRVSLFDSYFDDPSATRAAFDEFGRLRTGDLVVCHPDGSIDFVDRAKDMLKVGGENVAASEVEAAIRTVAGVLEVAVVPATDRLRGEVPVAFVLVSDVIANDTALRGSLIAEIVTTCRRDLAHFKVPSEVRLVDELPRSTIGKVAKAVLRAGLTEGG